MSNIEIKQADVQDLPALTELFNQYRLFYGKENNLPACNQFLFERLINHESVIYLALLDNKPVGFTQLYPSFSSVSLKATWILNDLFVIPSARKKGVGQALIKQCQDLVTMRQDKGLELSTAINNQQAQALYQQTGFQQDTDFYHYFWDLSAG